MSSTWTLSVWSIINIDNAVLYTMGGMIFPHVQAHKIYSDFKMYLLFSSKYKLFWAQLLLLDSEIYELLPLV